MSRVGNFSSSEIYRLMSKGKGFTTLGCLCYDCGWHWAVTNGIIYEEQGKIVSECESDDLNVRFWQRLPEPTDWWYGFVSLTNTASIQR